MKLMNEGTRPAEDRVAEVERAAADYLAVSRARHLYASEADHERAEERAWARLQAARAAAEEG